MKRRNGEMRWINGVLYVMEEHEEKVANNTLDVKSNTDSGSRLGDPILIAIQSTQWGE